MDHGGTAPSSLGVAAASGSFRTPCEQVARSRRAFFRSARGGATDLPASWLPRSPARAAQARGGGAEHPHERAAHALDVAKADLARQVLHGIFAALDPCP